MRELYRIQGLQLNFIETAMINESCAENLMTLAHRITCEDAESLRGIISSLQPHKEYLRRVARDIVSTF